MNSDKQKIVYSEQVNDIISVPPRRIITSGTTMIFGLFVLLLLIAWIIRYPDIIVAPVEITTERPPVTLLSKITGRINEIRVSNSEMVDSGQVLAVMETTASTENVLALKRSVLQHKKPSELKYSDIPVYSDLGELQVTYASFLKALNDYDNYLKVDFYRSKIITGKRDVKAQEEYMRNLAITEKALRENFELQKRQLKRDSDLYRTKFIAESDFEKTKQGFNKSSAEYQQILLDESRASLDLSQKNQVLTDYINSDKLEKNQLAATLTEAFQNLVSQENIWENDYLIISPIKGVVDMTRIWSKNQSVTKDQPVLTVIPLAPGKYIGRLTLPMARSGKVTENMQVNIKLSGYPYMEYGMLRGFVRSKSMVASGDEYIIEVALPQGLVTQYNKKLDATQNMKGQAEIVTERLRLIERIINPFRYLVSRNKSLR